MKKSVSVVVPVYNAEKYLKLCIDSIINQTYKELEIIFVNDGSKDNSLKLLKEYEVIDSRIKVINQKNGGAYAARNKGLETATSDYITFIDSDDWVDKDYIQRLIDGIDKNTDVVVSGYNKLFNGNIKRYIPNGDAWDIFKYASTCGKLYKLSFLKNNKLNYKKRLIMEDVEFNINCYISGGNYKILNYAGYNYNINSSSVTNTSKDKSEQLVSALEIFNDIEKKAKNNRNDEDKKRYINFYILYFIYILNMCCHNAKRKFLLEKIKEFYNFLTSIDVKWYKVEQPKNESKKNKIVIFFWKFIYKYKLTNIFIKMFLMRNRKTMKKKIIYVSMLVVIMFGISLYFVNDYKQKLKLEELERNEKARQDAIYEDVVDSYSEYALTTKESFLYEFKQNEYVESKKVSSNFYLELEDKVESYEDTYFKLKDKEYYVYYKDVTKTEKKEFDSRYKKFVVWNQSIKPLEPVPIYYDDGSYIYLDEDVSYPIIIKDTNKYYIEYANRLGYVEINEKIQVVNENNSSVAVANSVAVLCYHYTYSSAAGEYCPNGIICHDEPQVSEQFNYLSQNNWFTPTMSEFEMYLDGKIQLPKKSLVITVDDGYWVPRMSSLLMHYNLNGTLFLIGELGTYEEHRTPNLEVHSHTYDLHDPGICSGGQGAPIKCLDRNTILADLKKSRETLHNSTVFCWPFYEFNDYAIGLVKEAGFTMAFMGGMYKAYPGVNKFLIPRYTIHNNTNLSQFIRYIS